MWDKDGLPELFSLDGLKCLVESFESKIQRSSYFG